MLKFVVWVIMMLLGLLIGDLIGVAIGWNDTPNFKTLFICGAALIVAIKTMPHRTNAGPKHPQQSTAGEHSSDGISYAPSPPETGRTGPRSEGY